MNQQASAVQLATPLHAPQSLLARLSYAPRCHLDWAAGVWTSSSLDATGWAEDGRRGEERREEAEGTRRDEATTRRRIQSITRRRERGSTQERSKRDERTSKQQKEGERTRDCTTKREKQGKASKPLNFRLLQQHKEKKNTKTNKRRQETLFDSFPSQKDDLRLWLIEAKNKEFLPPVREFY